MIISEDHSFMSKYKIKDLTLAITSGLQPMTKDPYN